MSSEGVGAKAKETANAVKELILATKNAAHKELKGTGPRVIAVLDTSVDAAGKGLALTLDTIDKRTAREQLPLLTAYHAVLKSRADFVERRIESLEKNGGVPGRE